MVAPNGELFFRILEKNNFTAQLPGMFGSSGPPFLLFFRPGMGGQESAASFLCPFSAAAEVL